MVEIIGNFESKSRFELKELAELKYMYSRKITKIKIDFIEAEFRFP